MVIFTCAAKSPRDLFGELELNLFMGLFCGSSVCMATCAYMAELVWVSILTEVRFSRKEEGSSV